MKCTGCTATINDYHYFKRHKQYDQQFNRDIELCLCRTCVYNFIQYLLDLAPMEQYNRVLTSYGKEMIEDAKSISKDEKSNAKTIRKSKG